jgi:hypothetical protein
MVVLHYAGSSFRLAAEHSNREDVADMIDGALDRDLTFLAGDLTAGMDTGEGHNVRPGPWLWFDLADGGRLMVRVHAGMDVAISGDDDPGR